MALGSARWVTAGLSGDERGDAVTQVPSSRPGPYFDHVFVYGTLRRGGANDINRLEPPPRWVGLADIAGTLFDLGAYPGARLGGRGRIRGEVYAITAELERRLDEIEEVWPQCKDEYARRAVEVVVAGCDRPLTCLVYEINPRYLEGRAAIDGGDWIAARSAS